MRNNVATHDRESMNMPRREAKIEAQNLVPRIETDNTSIEIARKILSEPQVKYFTDINKSTLLAYIVHFEHKNLGRNFMLMDHQGYHEFTYNNYVLFSDINPSFQEINAKEFNILRSKLSIHFKTNRMLLERDV